MGLPTAEYSPISPDQEHNQSTWEAVQPTLNCTCSDTQAKNADSGSAHLHHWLSDPVFLSDQLSRQFCLSLIPRQWAILAVEPVQWPCPGREANLQDHLTAGYAT